MSDYNSIASVPIDEQIESQGALVRAKIMQDRLAKQVMQNAIKKRADIAQHNVNSRKAQESGYQYLDNFQASRPGPRNQITAAEQEAIMKRQKRQFSDVEFMITQPSKSNIFGVDWKKMDSLKCVKSTQSGGVFMAGFGLSGAIVIKSSPYPINILFAHYVTG